MHGAITALTFGVPHFGLNKSIYKLVRFLNDWSVAPYNQCYSMKEIETLSKNVAELPRALLSEAVKINNDEIKNNFNRIIDVNFLIYGKK